MTASAEDWIRLVSVELPPRRARTLLETFDGDPQRLLAESETVWRSIVPDLTKNQLGRLSEARDRSFHKELAWLNDNDGRIVPFDDPAYPSNLREIPESPICLIARGELFPEDKFSIAIVGSRRATSYGLSLARRFARDLAAQGLTIVSGGARGIDTQAHLGALDEGGRTLAYLGCGVDISYPADNRKLFAEIANGHGALLSEFALGVRPEPWRFPARNRLISGTSLGVLVIESPADSGSMITAREAGDQGRDVFAIPGPIDTGRSAGCHKLIQDGAKLVQTVDDILVELGILTLKSPDAKSESDQVSPAVANLPPDQRKILDLLTLQPKQVQTLMAESALTAPQVSTIVTMLEMRGLARRVPGNAFVRVL